MRNITFEEALDKLNIVDYKERILHSNSHGELMHLMDYVYIAQSLEDTSWFREWFERVLAWAEQTWERPESIFQHILHMFGVTEGRLIKV